jgi:integrase
MDRCRRAWDRTHQIGGDPYKPSAIRSYRQGLNKYILPVIGQQKLSAVDQHTLQDLADDLAARGLSASTIRNALMPMRALYRRATARGLVPVNPTSKLALPAVRGQRDRIARPDEAATLIDALPPNQRALWATALYAGLRMGELQALTWNQIDLDTNLIQVERSWDRIAGFIEPKSRAGRRRVPITNTLRNHLLNHRLQQPPGDTGLVFPNRSGSRPFNPSTIKLPHHPPLARRRSPTNHPSRMPPHLRRLHDRRRHQRQSPQHLHGPLQHHHHPRPLRPPPPRKRTASSHPPRSLADKQPRPRPALTIRPRRHHMDAHAV